MAQQRIPAAGEPEGFWTLAPDLVVEIISPSDTALEVQGKVTDWLAAGCRLVWVVPDTQTVMEYRSSTNARILTVAETLAGNNVLPGFTCPISQIFT